MADQGSSKMDWMYKGPTALVDREDYLLGRKVDKSFKLLEAQEKGDNFSYADEVEKDLTPASIFSGKKSSGGPVDHIRKIKEDPLYQIEKKEQETLKQLLQNPIKMKQLKKLAEERAKLNKSKKQKKKRKKKRSSSSSSSDLETESKLDKSTIDKLLAAKLSSLKKKSKRNRKDSSSSSSSSSSSGSSDDESTYKKTKKDREHYDRPDRSSKNTAREYISRDRRDNRDRYRDDDRERDTRRDRQDRHRLPSPRRDRDRSRGNAYPRRRSRSRSRSPQKKYKDKPSSSTSTSTSTSTTRNRPQPEKRKPLSEEEMERRRREMMENAKVRDEDRKTNVARWRDEQRKEEEELAKQHESDFIRQHLLSAAESGSVEKRIKSNSYNIQKSSISMNQNFARR